MRPTDPFMPFGEKTYTAPTMGLVINTMCRLTWAAHLNTKMVDLARAIAHPLQSGDYAGVCNAIFDYGTLHFIYVRDPVGVEWIVFPPNQFDPIWPGSSKKKMIEDCDGQSMFIAGLCMALGFKCEFALASFDASLTPSHVFTVVTARAGQKMVLDTVAGSDISKMLGEMTACYLVDIENGVDAPMSGLGMPFNGFKGWRP